MRALFVFFRRLWHKRMCARAFGCDANANWLYTGRLLLLIYVFFSLEFLIICLIIVFAVRTTSALLEAQNQEFLLFRICSFFIYIRFCIACGRKHKGWAIQNQAEETVFFDLQILSQSSEQTLCAWCDLVFLDSTWSRRGQSGNISVVRKGVQIPVVFQHSIF